MAWPTKSRSSGNKCWRLCWRRSPNSCCSKRILLLQVWTALFSFSFALLQISGFSVQNIPHLDISQTVSFLLAPFIGWLADVKFGRYEMLQFGSMVSFPATIFFYFALFTGGSSILSASLFSAALILMSFGSACFIAALFPFLSDQLVGATSHELGAVVQWACWGNNAGFCLACIVYFVGIIPPQAYVSNEVYAITVGVAGIFATPLALIIISDCLCQQWLDRTHKVTNPIKLIIQVLNYTRKHRYPERRSAFTYLDEEQPSRMDFGKKKYGGPFTEEEVEDVKTILRLIPLVACFVAIDSLLCTTFINLFKNNDGISYALNHYGLKNWLFPVILIPLYRFLLHPFFQKGFTNMLTCIAAGVLMSIFGYVLLEAIGLYSVVVYDDIERYLSCIQLNTTVRPDYYVDWYWKLGPYVLFGTGKTLAVVVFYVFIIAQSPDKMKGLSIGLMLAFQAFILYLVDYYSLLMFTLCHDLLIAIAFIALLVVFLLLSKCYTLRERNRQINIQAIVEEHYERYMDQEEEYMRECGDDPATSLSCDMDN